MAASFRRQHGRSETICRDFLRFSGGLADLKCAFGGFARRKTLRHKLGIAPLPRKLDVVLCAKRRLNNVRGAGSDRTALLLKGATCHRQAFTATLSSGIRIGCVCFV